ncbi:MAG: hypothetical protein JWN70_5690 [Planctomycetaceae bacterium]|nr:hypothetical protein [Planctomycetaceae bacterium]
MSAVDIDNIVQDVLAAYDILSVPVDPLSIAREEGICLLPGEYDNCFDGRIECREDEGRLNFYLFYAEVRPVFRPESRVRFSIAHELGHYYLPRHREILLSGCSHSSHSDFVSDKNLEREADSFAASLLMPHELFVDEVRSRSGGYCTLKDLIELANHTFNTSITSTALRYAHLNFEACCVVLSRAERVLYSVRSEDMKSMGLGYVAKGVKLPKHSVTAKQLSVAPSRVEMSTLEGTVHSDLWFDSGRRIPLWEEAIRLGGTGLTLTFLTPENKDDDRDDD